MRDDDEGRRCLRWGQRCENMEDVVNMSMTSSQILASYNARTKATYSATAAPFLEIVLASTTNATAFASDMYSRNWSRIRG